MALVCCQPVGKLMCPEDRPSPIFTVFAVIINLATAVIAAAYAVSSEAKDCVESKMKTWMWIAMMICLVNIGFAIYLYWRVCSKVKEMGIVSAVWKLFLYDIGVCLYMMFFIFMIVWCGVGGNHADSADDDPTNPDKPCDTMSDRIRTVVGLLIAYMVVGGFLLCFSTMTECCREPRWKQNNQQQQHHPHPQAAPASGGGFSSLWPFGKKNQQQAAAQPHGQVQMQPQQQAGYPPQQAYPQQQQQQYPPQQAAYPPQQAGYPPQQGEYPPQQVAYPPQQADYPPQQYPQQSYPQQQQQQQQPPQQKSMAEKVGHSIGTGIGKLVGGKK
eukprot:TRINITY_DN4786_c2_g2_i1.p1 TRINITY_DN4786_c2_g2~~TRINITY_DN4786_c2_g2_i1.p1  ORF type:complete len:345 (+),score=75.46 TRINITY_DN4786_c2_g2_i1:54-1037(+)